MLTTLLHISCVCGFYPNKNGLVYDTHLLQEITIRKLTIADWTGKAEADRSPPGLTLTNS